MNIVNNNIDRILYPLTHPQKRIWYIEKIYLGTSLHNIGGPIRIKGAIDFSILEESINILIKNNEGLRLRFVEEDGEAKQFVSNYERVKLDFIDFSKYENPEEEFNKWVKKEARKSFVIENERLFYFAMFRISDNDNGYLAKFHHIISDGWSINIMTGQICDTYMKFLYGEEIHDSTEPSYVEYISNEKKYLLSDRFIKNKSFWNEKFKTLPDALLNKSSDVIEGKRKSFELEPEVSAKMKKFAADNKYSLNTFFVTLYLIYLYRTTQQEDIVIGTPVLNRSGKKEKGMFGMFTSTMPFRFVVDDNLNVKDTMAKVNDQLMECYFNQKYPYDLLVQDLELKKKGYNNLFNTCVNYYNTKLNSELSGFPIENVEFYNGNQIYSLQLVIKEWSDTGNLTLDFDYKANDYYDWQIKDIHFRLLSLAKQIILNPLEKIGSLNLLSDDEIKKLLYEFNATKIEYPGDKMIYQLFEEQVKRTPDKVAICFNNIELSYSKLNEKANQLARYLVRKGVEKETNVGLLTTHSIETVIGILGILKAGGAYLPIDPGNPNDRICYMLEDSGCIILLTNIELPISVGFSGDIINLNNQDIYSGDSSNPKCVNKPNDLAYVIYTSGSTGKPKGTMIEHLGLVNYIWWAKKMYVKNEDEVFPLYSSLAFDLTVTSIFTPLISGSKIIVYDENSNDEYVLFRIMKENKSTVIKLTPSHLSLLKDMNNIDSSVRRFIVGGEDLKVNLAKEIHKNFGGNVEIFNEYGPTETVVGCMIHKYAYESNVSTSVPIGIPADNVQIYILDKNLKPVPANTVGEIFISGDGVARGYLNRPELTREKFVDNPFINGRRMYKTGDLARFLNNGIIEYAGRADHQVKIRGYRIELGEIEKYLLSHEAVKDAIVIDLEDKYSSKYLCAYIVKKADVSKHKLKNFLLEYLPDYMVPLYFIELDVIPLTQNGKVNRELLPKPENGNIENEEFAEYRNEKERNLVNAICDVLNIERVSVRQNFYHLGGDSIKAIQIASKLNDKGFKVRVKDILSTPIIEEMALYVEHRKGLDICQGNCEGSIKPTSIMSWYFAQKFANPHHYTQSILLELKQNIDLNNLENAFSELIRHHDSLRINYNSQTGELFYNSEYLNKHFDIETYDLSAYTLDEQRLKVSNIGEIIKSSFNIEKGLLIKAGVFILSENQKLLLLTAHHLVVDGVSWSIIAEDLYTLLKQMNTKQKIKLPLKTYSLQRWTELISECTSEQASECIIPCDNDDSSIFVERFTREDIYEKSNKIEKKLSRDMTYALLSVANKVYNTNTLDLIVVSIVLAVKDIFNFQKFSIDLEGHGRDEILESVDITRTVGWFTRIYTLYFNISENEYSSVIRYVREQIRKTLNDCRGSTKWYENQKLCKSSIIKLNYLGDFSSTLSNEIYQYSDYFSGNDFNSKNHMTNPIEIDILATNGVFNIQLTYSRNIFEDVIIENLSNKFTEHITKMIEYFESADHIDFIPSDFDTVDISKEELDSLFI